ncbi:MAG: aminoacyl-tRNA hydrolase [Victivallales bacterium]|nr:aminoacyl-tRNA hydrolase [Victivallales bacterium]
MSGAATGRISLVVGLGNPGREYEKTRHNAGFMATARLRERLPGEFEQIHGFSGVYWKGRLRGQNLYLLQPMTFMNLSGKSVAAMMRTLNFTAAEILVVYDDSDLPLGRIRFRQGGSSGGHRGIESLIGEIGTTQFARLRIGIGSEEKRNQVDFVLSGFAAAEQPLAAQVLDTAAAALQLALYRGIGVAMNEYNGMEIMLENNEMI